MAKNTVKLRSNFKAVKDASKEAIQHAVDEALIEGEQETQKRLSKAVNTRGYNLDPFVVQRKDFPEGEGGMLYVRSDKWFYRFFEFGTVYIPASPFMRPAHRRMRKVFLNEMGDNFEKFVARRSRMSVSTR